MRLFWPSGRLRPTRRFVWHGILGRLLIFGWHCRPLSILRRQGLRLGMGLRKRSDQGPRNSWSDTAHRAPTWNWTNHDQSGRHTFKLSSNVGPGARMMQSFGRRLRAAGASFEDRQDLLGHRAERTTIHYSAIELSHLIEAANSVRDRQDVRQDLVVLRPDSAPAETHAKFAQRNSRVNLLVLMF